MEVKHQALYEHDTRLTKENRERLQRNKNLLYWYKNLYDSLLGDIVDLDSKAILEIGSGTSPLKLFYPQVITSDVLDLDYLDHVFDCHEIDSYAGIEAASIDIVTLTNVLHHLRDPIRFLRNVTAKLKPAGMVILVEPYFSAVSYPIYRLLHHEPADFAATYPGLDHVDGPLSTSNQAIPYMIFFSKSDWLEQLDSCYDLSKTEFSYFSSLSYMLTGGISRTFPVPASFYRPIYSIDNRLAKRFPRLFASFFIAKLTTAGKVT